MSRILLQVVLLCSLFSPAAYADITDATNCGFVSNYIRFNATKRDHHRIPAAIFHSADGRYFLLTPTYVFDNSYDFYFRDGENEQYFKTQTLLSGENIYPPPVGPQCRIQEVPFEELEEELKEVVRRCAITEEQFAAPKLGMQVTIHGQSYSNNSPGEVHRGVIASAEDRTYNAKELEAHPYHLILPASKACPATSWVVSDEPVDGIERPVVGLIMDHVLYKSGDCLLDINGIRILINGSQPSIFERLFGLAGAPTRPSACAFIRNLQNVDQFSERWAPTGLNRLDKSLREWQGDKAVLNDDDTDDKFGFPACMLRDNDNVYLVIDPSSYRFLQEDSLLCAYRKGNVDEFRMADYFDISSGSPRIDIDGVFIAFPCLADKERQEMFLTSSFPLADESENVETDFIFGRSIPNFLLRERLEEAIVYASTQTVLGTTPESSNYYDSGIYPAVLFSSINGRERFFGLLGFNVQTQESTIYTVSELSACISAQQSQ